VGEALERFAGWLERAVELIGRVTAWLALALVLLMSANVLLRYLFHIGSVWSQELEWHLLVPLALFGMSYGILKDGHLRVDLLYVRFNEHTRLWIDCVSAVLLAFVALATFWLSLGYVEQSSSIGEGSPDPGGLPYRYVLKAFIPLGFALLAVLGFAQALKLALRLVRRRPA
jgi:TRAP-type mannitol/chloroaromatic compound transport system permease small subunit